jgi:hypothetical protein
MYRYYIEDASLLGEVEELLDNAGIEFDWDGGDRLLIEENDAKDVEAILDANDITYDAI